MGYYPNPDRVISRKEYQELAIQLFGPDQLKWRFYCPTCKKDHTRAEMLEKWPNGINAQGTCCVHCGKKLDPPGAYGTFIGFRVRFMPGECPGYEIPPQGQFVYALPFWQEGETAHPYSTTARPAPVRPPAGFRLDAPPAPPEPTPEPPPVKEPAPPPPPKKAGPSGYGFRF